MRSLRCALFLTVVLVSAAPVPSSATAPQRQTAETATQFYLRWRTTALNAKSMDEITPFWTADTVHEFNMEPESAKADTLTMLKRVYGTQTDVKSSRKPRPRPAPHSPWKAWTVPRRPSSAASISSRRTARGR